MKAFQLGMKVFVIPGVRLPQGGTLDALDTRPFGDNRDCPLPSLSVPPGFRDSMGPGSYGLVENNSG
jgi:hypothetical protein